MFEKGALDNIQQGTKLLAILDENWPEFLREEKCMIRDRLNRWIVPLDEGGRGEEYDGYFRTSIRQVCTTPPGVCVDVQQHGRVVASEAVCAPRVAVVLSKRLRSPCFFGESVTE